MSLFVDDNEIVLMHFAVEQGYFKGETILFRRHATEEKKTQLTVFCHDIIKWLSEERTIDLTKKKAFHIWDGNSGTMYTRLMHIKQAFDWSIIGISKTFTEIIFHR